MCQASLEDNDENKIINYQSGKAPVTQRIQSTVEAGNGTK